MREFFWGHDNNNHRGSVGDRRRASMCSVFWRGGQRSRRTSKSHSFLVETEFSIDGVILCSCGRRPRYFAADFTMAPVALMVTSWRPSSLWLCGIYKGNRRIQKWSPLLPLLKHSKRERLLPPLSETPPKKVSSFNGPTQKLTMNHSTPTTVNVRQRFNKLHLISFIQDIFETMLINVLWIYLNVSTDERSARVSLNEMG